LVTKISTNVESKPSVEFSISSCCYFRTAPL